MRLVKRSTDEFPDDHDLVAYFREVLPARDAPGLFFFGRQIGGDALEPGETLLFCYRGSIRYVASKRRRDHDPCG
jgi:hypothetical protein